MFMQPGGAFGSAWLAAGGLIAAFAILFEVYQPALHGPFVFDDLYLPFTERLGMHDPLRDGLTPRPLLMFSYWINYRAFGLDTYQYHLHNVLFHFIAALMVYLVVRRFLVWTEDRERAAGGSPRGWRREMAAVFAGGLFLLHPLQTEAVAYIAGRSESLSVMFFFAAFAAFLYRPAGAISFGRAIPVLLLFGAACLSKEHTVILPALLLLTDYWWNPGFSFQGIRRNWRLYLPVAAIGAAAFAFVASVLRGATTAGFNLADFTWQQYFYTQCRAIWVYVRMFLVPAGQNIDHHFPVSQTIADRGAIFGLAGLLALAAAAWFFRRRFPLAAFGVLVFLLLLAPTSSIVPIADPLAERRMYMPVLGLLLVAADVVRRIEGRPAAMIGVLSIVLLLAGGATWRRNHVWADSVALWEESVAAAPNVARNRFQLGFAYYERGRCADALTQYEKAHELDPKDLALLVDWALAYDCLNQPGPAIGKLLQAAELGANAHIYSLLGMLYAKQGKIEEAMQALESAIRLDATFDTAYIYRGNIYLASGDVARAAEDYRHAIRLNPSNQAAWKALKQAEQSLRGKK